LAKAEDTIPGELQTPNYRITKLEGIGYNRECQRQDPSNVIKVGDTYHVYTSKFTAKAYKGVIGHATSTDGIHWKDQHGDALSDGAALSKGPADAWDNCGVFTPYIMAYKGKYYLYYTSCREIRDEPFASRGPNNGRHIGLAVAESPYGPWKKLPGPILSPGKEGEWDSYLVDDAHVIVRNGQFWLYYKGGDIKVTAGTTHWGVAIADNPQGPFVKHEMNPLIGGHTVCVWPHREGVAALVDDAGPERHTVQWSPDGLHFQRAAKIESGVHTGCGPYDPDAHANVSFGHGITWGVAQERGEDGRMYIVRFEVDCLWPTIDNSIKVPKELINPNKRSVKTTGLPDNPDEENHDPSNIIRFNGAYYLWYTGYPPGKGGPTNARIKLAVSKDGYHWDIRGTALENNTPGHWDAGGVMTAYVVPTQGKYYMFYSGVCPKYTQEQHRLYPKSIGIAVADTPDGPWKRYSGNPILQPEEHTWEGLICDDANVFYKDNKWWLYYKGLPKNGKPGETKIGIAFAQNITGPYEKYKGNPIMHGHAFTAWIHRNGVAFIGGNYGAQNVFWSEDGIHFIKAGGFQNRSTGLYCPENFGNGENPNGVWWGLGVGMDRRYIYRFECDLKVED
jgi:beta-xylosidase